VFSVEKSLSCLFGVDVSDHLRKLKNEEHDRCYDS